MAGRPSRRDPKDYRVYGRRTLAEHEKKTARLQYKGRSDHPRARLVNIIEELKKALGD